MNLKNIAEFILSWGLIIGSLVSYIPQYYKIYKTKSTLGISEYMLISGVMSSYFNVLGSVQENYSTVMDCDKGWDCYHIYLPIIQLGSSYMCFLLFYSYFLIFFNNTSKFNIFQPIDDDGRSDTRLRGLIVFLFSILLQLPLECL